MYNIKWHVQASGKAISAEQRMSEVIPILVTHDYKSAVMGADMYNIDAVEGLFYVVNIGHIDYIQCKIIIIRI